MFWTVTGNSQSWALAATSRNSGDLNSSRDSNNIRASIISRGTISSWSASNSRDTSNSISNSKEEWQQQQGCQKNRGGSFTIKRIQKQKKPREQQGLFLSRKLATPALPGIFEKSATEGTLATAKMQVIAGKQKIARTPGTPTGARTEGSSTATAGTFCDWRDACNSRDQQ